MSTNSPSSSPGDQPPVGIDLGTTYSVVAYLDSSGRPATVLNGWGDLLTPSAVLCDEEIVVGKEAVKSSALCPDKYAECFKRDMGGPSFHYKIRGLDVPPEVLSAFVLERLKKDAEQRLGRIRRVVITVPAFFDETRRKATQDAGRLAGLEVLDIINEPTAAALAFAHHRGFLGPSPSAEVKQQRVLVYDLGGGTFDVTILQIEAGSFRALATDGDVRLGGKDFDERLVNHLAEQFLAAQGIDPRSDPQNAAQLWLDAQEAKHGLSERGKTSVVCFHAGIRMRIEITRDQFENLIGDLVERTETTTSLVVSQAGLQWPDIDRVLLVGGSSRIPAVRKMLQRISGKEPDCSQSPDEAVAHGAALYAGILTRRAAAGGQPTCEVVNVNSHSLGVVGVHAKTQERLNVVLIPKNSPLPCRAVRSFQTAKPDQRSVRVAVVEGESHRPEDCIALGECVVRDLPPCLAKGTPVEVEYQYAANGRISVSARIPSVRLSTNVEIRRTRTHDLADLETWRKRLLGQAVPSQQQGFTPSCGDETIDLGDRASVLKRLDALYLRVGQAAAGLELPAPLSRSRAAALASAAERDRARAECREAEQARQTAATRAEIIRLDALLSKSRAEQQQQQVRCDFSLLVLGRDCFNAGFNPPGREREIEQIRQLRKHVGQ
jgi:molecular chaperone DnaK